MRLSEAQKLALLTDERAIEELPFRDRDELIAAGLAHRAWPQKTGDGQWRTWLTAKGVALRLRLVGGNASPIEPAGRRALGGEDANPTGGGE